MGTGCIRRLLQFKSTSRWIFIQHFSLEAHVGALTLQCLPILWIRSISDFPFSSEAPRGCAGRAWQSCCKQQAKLWAPRRRFWNGSCRDHNRPRCLMFYPVKNCSNAEETHWHSESTELRGSPSCPGKPSLVALLTGCFSGLGGTLLPWDFPEHPPLLAQCAITTAGPVTFTQRKPSAESLPSLQALQPQGLAPQLHFSAIRKGALNATKSFLATSSPHSGWGQQDSQKGQALSLE